ncbi:hypothetical protein RIF29_14874 [Crotalaria pallida]|uniref:Transmembrane protein n=1 Tax=Crotalaria pallida TaxID=3830 RepID=A0AAN9FG96_CROPI
MPSFRRSGSNFCLFFFLVAVLIVLLGMVSTTEGIRDLKDFKSLFGSQLPKGPVPPSGPSLCHNKLSPYRDSKVSFPNDYYIICP